MSEDSTKEALLRASTPPSKALFSTLITANHILHYHNVVDGKVVNLCTFYGQSKCV